MDKRLRFKVGDRVLAWCGENWREAVVTKLWSKEGRGLSTYRMRTVGDNLDIHTTIDSTNSVRAYTEPGLPRLIQEIQLGSSWEDAEASITSYGIDVGIVGPNLLLPAAMAGNDDVVTNLIKEHGVSEATCDKDGRNILHIALLHKHFHLVDVIREEYEDLFLHTDNKGFNAIHFIVMSKNIDLLQEVLFDVEFFPNTSADDIENLVDPTNQRYGDVNAERTTSVITPLEWAKRTKQEEMARVLEKFINELRINHKLAYVAALSMKHPNCESGAIQSVDQDVLTELRAVDNQIVSWGLLKSELDRSRKFLTELTCTAINCCKHGYINSLTHIIADYFASLPGRSPENYVVRLARLVEETIYGPEKQAFPTHSDQYRIKMDRHRFTRELSAIYKEWNAEEPLLVFTARMIAKRKTGQQELDPWDKMMFDYMEKLIIAGNGGMLITERAEVLQYLLSRPLPSGGHLALPIHAFVMQGQLHLLQWAVRAGRVDLKSPVGACASLVEHVRTLSWLSLETKAKNKPRGIPGDLTVAEVLCALAAGYGEIFILQWLLEEVIPTARHGVTFNGRDLLYIAALQSNLIIVKYLLAHKSIREWQIVKAIEKGMKTDVNGIAKFLLDAFKVGKPLPDQHLALMVVAHGSGIRDLESWYNLEVMRMVCADLQRQMEANVCSEELARYFDNEFELTMDHGWTLSSLGRVDGENDTTIYCTQIDLAQNIESLLTCLLTLAIRANKPDFLDHIVNKVMASIKDDRVSNSYRCSETSFVCLYSQLSGYAARVGNTEISAHLTTVCKTLFEQLVATPSEAVDTHVQEPFQEMMRLFESGAAVEILEACVLRQRAVASGENHSESTMMSLGYLAHTHFQWCSQLVSAGHLHIIRWVLETKKVQISLPNAERALEAAAMRGRVEILQYLLHRVYDATPPSHYLIDGGPDDLQSEVTDEEEPRVITFANLGQRVRQKVCELFLCALRGYSFHKKDPLVMKDPHAAVLDYLLDYAIDKGYILHITIHTLTKAIDQLQARDHPDMWAFVRRLCEVKEIRDSFKYGTSLLNAVLEEMFYRVEPVQNDETPQEANERLATHSIAIVKYLLELDVPPDLDYIVTECASISSESYLPSWEKIIQLLYAHGFGIQRIVYTLGRVEDKSLFLAASVRLEELKAAQRKQWEIFDVIAAGRSVDCLSTLMLDGKVNHLKDRSGRNLMQVAAVHDRGDVILWLHREHQMDIKAVDREGLSVLMLCRRAGSLSAARMVAEAIGGDTVRAFCCRHFYRRRVLRAARAAQKRRVTCVVKMQSCVRGRLVRCKYAPLLREVKGSWNAFVGKWGAVMTALKEIRTQRLAPFSWAEQKFKYDMAVDVSEQDVEVQQFLDQAASSAQEDRSSSEPSTLEFSKIIIDSSTSSSAVHDNDIADPVDAVELSQAVVRWLDKADETYRAMFHKKVARLSLRSRSYALSKRLKGCEYPICESKLDAGQRILWTYISRDDKQHVLIWFVSKHDNVSHCARLIDNACARTFRSLNRATSDTKATEKNLLLTLTEDSVLLDPSRNVPMKIYIAQRSELPLLAEKAWKAPLRLNQREQGVRSQTGTVLLLGRSGTGKTLCVMDRMNHDRAESLLQAANDKDDGSAVPFKQLFVTRSSALCDFVRLYQQHNCAAGDLAHTEYATFENFLRQLESASDAAITSTKRRDLSASKKVDYLRFRDHVFPLLTIKSTSTLDALVVWTQIRTFLKGSIEAALEGGLLSLATYLDTSKFSRDRCRLLLEQRQEVYALFVQYQALNELHGWWDDMDRAMQVLRPNLSFLLHHQQQQSGDADIDKGTRESEHYKYGKIYVDEVQDNTQVEIALYLVAVGGRVDALFLAGDPAQSVVEGVEFRFEEVRSLVYVLSQQQEALQRPTKLLVNYRSHSGILNCAGAVLGRMLAMFPGAAKTLPADEGLFLGPRPAFLSATDNEADGMLREVRKLLAGNERLVVLCPDERAADVSAQLSAAVPGKPADTTSSVSVLNLVLGIRAAKGLEFTDIVLLDFFSAIPDSDYKAWKELLAVGGEGQVRSSNSSFESQQYAFPQLEPQLKLLYTGITRCINRLIFLESRRSRIGGLFFRWLKQHGLADAFTLTSEANGAHQQQLIMTRDEWRMRGIDIALSAESAGDLARSEQLLGQAAQCFQRAEEPGLKAVAVAQASLFETEARYCNDMLSTSMEKKQGQRKNETELSPAEEVTAASAVLRGLRLGLHGASQHLCHRLEDCLNLQYKRFFKVELLRMFLNEQM